jgi:hypothetical protein
MRELVLCLRAATDITYINMLDSTPSDSSTAATSTGHELRAVIYMQPPPLHVLTFFALFLFSTC